MRYRFTGRNSAIVATHTIPRHTTVIKDSAREGVGVVAIVAGVAALNVTGIFARGHCSIMATQAGAQY